MLDKTREDQCVSPPCALTTQFQAALKIGSRKTDSPVAKLTVNIAQADEVPACYEALEGKQAAG